MKRDAGVVVGMVLALAGFLAPAVAGAQEPAAPAAKVYLSMSSTRVDVEFKPLLEFTPAVVVNPGGRRAWEAYVTDAARPAAEALTAEVRQAIQASLDDRAAVVDAPLTGVQSDAKMFGAALAALPFMQRRGVPVTVAVDNIVLAADYAGTVVNPDPKSNPQMGWGELFSNLGRSVSNMSGTKPFTFDGLTRLSYRVQYKVYATATGELLREGEIGPLLAESQPWQGSWTFPPNEPFFEATCVGGVCDTKLSVEKASKHVTDPRPVILPEAISQLEPQVKEAVAKSFSDWPDLLAAGQELAAQRR